MTRFRTDRHNNPAAFTTDIAKQGGLILGEDYDVGDSFKSNNKTFHTAKLLDDPLGLTIRVIDKITFFTHSGQQRWVYIGVPNFLWKLLNYSQKVAVIKEMYKHEGGKELKHLFKV